MRCDQLTPWAYKDLARTLDQLKQRGGNISGGGTDSIYNYARAVRFIAARRHAAYRFRIPAPPQAPERGG